MVAAAAMASRVRQRAGGAEGGGHHLEGAPANCAGLCSVGSSGKAGQYWSTAIILDLVNSGYGKVPQIMHLLRCLFFIRAHFQMGVVAVHVPGVENHLADAISRNHLHVLFSQVPEVAKQRSVIPPSLLALLVERQPDWTSSDWAQLFTSCFQLA